MPGMDRSFSKNSFSGENSAASHAEKFPPAGKRVMIFQDCSSSIEVGKVKSGPWQKGTIAKQEKS
jgi:hypothetical protein